MREIICRRLAGKKVLILGVGNSMRGDDGAGPSLIAHLHGKVDANLIDAGDVPENWLGPIIAMKPEVVVMVDAADLGSSPGDIAIIEMDEISQRSISTHNASLDLAARFLTSSIQVDIFLLGIQPASLAFGEKLTPRVKRSVNALAALLLKCLPVK
jgi:hydrogenase 3 maturation protease